MLHLRQTWNDIFPLTELQKIDMKLNRQWPIYSGHVVQSSTPIVVRIVMNFPSIDLFILRLIFTLFIQDLKNQLEQELLQLKIKKLELDLAAKQKLLTHGSLAISAHIPNSNIPAAVQIQNYINSTNCDQQMNNAVPQNIQVPIQTSTVLLPAHSTNVNQ